MIVFEYIIVEVVGSLCGGFFGIFGRLVVIRFVNLVVELFMLCCLVEEFLISLFRLCDKDEFLVNFCLMSFFNVLLLC